MKKLKWIAVIVAVLMVSLVCLHAYAAENAELISGYHSFLSFEKEQRGCLTVAAGLAIVLAWLSCKMEKPLRVLGISIGVSSAIALVMIRESSKAMGQFVLILALLLVIIWLVGSMIHRQLAQRNR